MRLGLVLGLLTAPATGLVQAVPVAAATCGPQAPGAYPNDPRYSPAENGFPLTPNTWDGEQWYLYGCIPQDVQVTAHDPEGAAGMGVDQVWAQYTKGRDDVLVAYMEGGVNWRIPPSCELRLRSYLNRGELPFPENGQGKTKIDLGIPGDAYDLNGDGVFNVDDYRDDPRVRQVVAAYPKNPPGGPYLHHVCSTIDSAWSDITPEDLIVAFGHCRIVDGRIVGGFPCDPSRSYDNDGNGYSNDISGWNFNRDDNDPQTDQSIYEHFDGESAQLVGEGNNHFLGIGVCPRCRYLPIKAGDEAIDRPDRVAEAIVFAVDSGVKVFDGTDASLGLTPEVAAAVDYAYHHGMVVVWASNDFESADHTDGMWLPHVWPGNSLTGDHSTRGGATCPGPFCAFVLSNGTFRSRSSLTSYGPHALFSVPNNDGSTSTGTPTQAGVAALVISAGLDAWEAHRIAAPLSPDEVKQVVRSTASPISSPCPTCFSGAAASFNRMYGYGRPNVYRAVQAVQQNRIPPTVDIRTPDWYQAVDPLRQRSLHVAVDVAAPRAHTFHWEMQFATGSDPTDSDFHVFASGSSSSGTPRRVAADLPLAQLQSYAARPFVVDAGTRTSIEAYDVTIRVQVTDDRGLLGEDRRAFYARHDDTEMPGFPVRVGVSGEASPTMADIEGRGWLDTIVPTANGVVHAFRPDGSEAPGFPVHTGPPPGMDPRYPHNYLSVREWRNHLLPRPGDPILSAAAVGDLRHDGALEIVVGTLSGYTYAWDGAGRLLPGFPVLDGSPENYGQSVPPPDTPYSFNPENFAGPSPVLVDLTGDGHLDIVQAAADDHVYAWHVDDHGVSAVPGWPVCTVFQLDAQGSPHPGQPCREQPPPAPYVHTHDTKIVPTPAIADVDGDGRPDVVVGLDDSSWDTSSPLGSNKVTTYVEAFDARGTLRSPTGELPGWPIAVPGLIQGYGVAQDFVTQGTESPVVYDTPSGPQLVVNSNLFLPVRVDLRTRQLQRIFAGASIAPIAGPNISPGGALVQFTTSPSAGNVLQTATPQIFQAGSAGIGVALGVTQTPGLGVRVDNGLGAWDPTTGVTLPQFDQYLQGLGFFTAPAIADVTGDGRPDVLQAGDSAELMGLDGATGQPALGFPKWTGGFSLFTPAVGDIDADGTVEVAVSTREGYLHMWRTPGQASADDQAWHWHQDDRNTGHYGTDTRPPAAVRGLGVVASPSGDTLRFTAPGDDWNVGTAARYQVFRSSHPITQDTVAAATLVAVDAVPRAAGTPETIVVPHLPGQPYYAVRAIDHAGNIGPLPVAVAGGSAPGGVAGELEAIPNTGPTGATPLLLPGAAAVVLGCARRRRRS